MNETQHYNVDVTITEEAFGIMRGTIVLDNDLTYKWSAYEKNNPHGSEDYYACYRVHNYPGWRKRKDAREIRKAIATAVIHRKRVSFQTQASHRSVEHSP